MPAELADAVAAHDPDTAPDPAVARLRPEPRRRAGVIEGFVPIELAARGPRALRPTDRAPLPPRPPIETVESWVDRETLFGDA